MIKDLLLSDSNDCGGGNYSYYLYMINDLLLWLNTKKSDNNIHTHKVVVVFPPTITTVDTCEMLS